MPAHSQPFVSMPTLVVVLVLMIGLRHATVQLTEVAVISCTEDMPILRQQDEFMDNSTLAGLFKDAVGHPESWKLSLSNSSFSKTRGFVLRFNRDGAAHLADPAFSFLVPYFERARDPEANAFVLNVLIIPPSPANDDVPSVGMHLDDTVGIDSPRRYVAHTVSVLYLQVPQGMDGGILEIFHVPEDARKPGGRTTATTPNVVVHPKVNQLNVFRGDAFHQITAMHVPRRRAAEAASDVDMGDSNVSGPLADDYRVSLVLEQYRVPASAYPATTTFDVNRRDEGSKITSKVIIGMCKLYNDVSKFLITGTMAVGVLMMLLPSSMWDG